MMGLNFDHDGTNSAVTHVLGLSASVRRNEWLWRTLDIDNISGQLLTTLGHSRQTTVSTPS